MSEAMRIGDTERERALASLGEHYALGRLSKEELDERSDAVWTARTRHDLAVLFEDLPTPAPAAGPPASRPVRRRGFRMPPAPVLLLVLALVVLVKMPLLLLAVGLWFLLSRRHWSGGCGHRSGRSRSYGTRYDTRAYSSGS